ncbi:zinc ribbon domain-containing protein [Streptomyces sp. NPDC055092]
MQRSFAIRHSARCNWASVLGVWWRFAPWRLGTWAEFIAYKSREAVVPVVHVNPAYTTRTCTQCGHIDKANRRCERALLSGRVRTVR